jgi:hypothetical protein
MAAGASSASGGGLAGGDAGGGQADGGETLGGQQHSANGQSLGSSDVAALMETLSSIAQGQEEMRSFLTQNPWGGEPGGEYGDDAYDDELGLGDYGAEGESGELDPEALAGLEPGSYNVDDEGNLSIDPQALVQQEVQRQLQPIAAQQVGTLQYLSHKAMGEAANHLASVAPELENPETAEQVMDAAYQFAGHLAGQMGIHPQQITNSPAIFALARIMYMAGRAEDMAREEEGRADAPAPATLEGGSGSGPGGGRPMDSAGFLKSLTDGQPLGANVLPFT